MERFWISMALAGLAAFTPVAAQSSDPLFDDAVVHDVRLRMHPNDWKLLIERYLENTYYAAEFQWQGNRIFPVGIRSRGLGSRSNVKPGLKLDFNRYNDKQEFLGLKALILDNSTQDVTFLRERLSMALFRRLGLPAPREAYAKLFVNDEFIGIYSIVEDVDKAFLRRNFAEDDGYLYEFKWLLEYRFEPLNESLPAVLDLFSPRTKESNPAPETLTALIDEVNHASDEEFPSVAARYFDVDRFILHLAVENYLAEFDGLTGYAGMNNFYLYRQNGSTRFTVLAWDKDVTMSTPEHEIFYNIETNTLTRRLFQSDDVRRKYLESLRQIANEAGGPDGWLAGELERAVGQIQGIVPQDRRLPATVADFEDGVVQVREFVAGRAAWVLAQIEAATAGE